MLRMPGNLSPGSFLARHWQKHPLFMPAATGRLKPAISRNELAWLATLEDVESRIVFTERDGTRTRYRVETGPFETSYLAALPRRDWTLLVHDVEKHLPAMRGLFALVPFVPDWRIDDLMVSFAAPGGSVGPHLDQYDVFLCQGTGTRQWRVLEDDVAPDPLACDDLSLLAPFEGETFDTRQGDVLYLPPGVAHWGIARRACLTYSIGMRAPRRSDLLDEFGLECPDEDPFYADPDLAEDEVRPGYISPAAVARAKALVAAVARIDDQPISVALGRTLTRPKAWLRPDCPETREIDELIARGLARRGLRMHGMARVAWDDAHVFANGNHVALPAGAHDAIEALCGSRHTSRYFRDKSLWPLLGWLLSMGVFELDAVQPDM